MDGNDFLTRVVKLSGVFFRSLIHLNNQLMNRNREVLRQSKTDTEERLVKTIRLIWLVTKTVSYVRPGTYSLISRVSVRPKRLIVVPPGGKLLRLSEILFSPKTVTLTFRPLIADWQYEYFEALKAKRPGWQLRLISIRYAWHYAKACGLSKIVQVFKAVAKS